MDYIVEGKVDFVINVPDPNKQIELDDTYHIRRAAVDFSVPLITNTQVANVFVEALFQRELSKKKKPERDEDILEQIKAWDEY